MARIILIGGDRRSLYLSDFLSRKGYLTYGFAQSPGEPLTLLWDALQQPYVAVILPLPATKDGVHVHTPLWDGALPFASLQGRLRPGAAVLGGQLPNSLSEQLLANGVPYTDYYDEQVIVRNADLTAKGVMRVLGEHTDRPPDTLRFVVTGFGRVAKATVRELQAHGGKVLVAARSTLALRAAAESGADTVPLCTFLEKPADFDVLVNTVPATLFDAAVLSKTPKDALLIDVASAPFGLDFEAAAACGLQAIKAQSLPGKYFPEAAAQILGEKIQSLL